MPNDPSIDDPAADALRSRIDLLEREQHDRLARANAALAREQDKSYWLDRWHVDLNALMRRRGASELRAGLRGARAVYRALYDARWRARQKLDSLRDRSRVASRVLEAERAAGPTPEEEPLVRLIDPQPLGSSPVTDLLYARLEEADLRAIEERLEPAEAALWETADARDRRRLALAFAAHHGVGDALERTGLSSAMPDAEVHSMAREASAAGGSPYYADLVVDALEGSGFTLREGQVALDFGCSSGRVVRVLGAAHPELSWHGCDPNERAVEWAAAHLQGVEFAVSPQHPPLPYSDGQFDFVFAISIWSHFAEGAALDWLREMRRVIRPGGRLVLTTHGGQTVVHTHETGVRSAEQLRDVRRSLLESGFWYAAEFGEAGDHGVANPYWGTAFLTPEWLMAKLTPQWRPLLFRAGRAENNQDLYVLERG